jgi:hypothetical protein
MFTIQADEEKYRIVTADGQESETVVYGEPTIIKVGEDYYYACCDVDKDGELSDGEVFRIDSVTPVTTEVVDVEFEDDEEEEEEEDDPESVEVE